MKNILLVDYSNLAFRIFYSFNNRTENGLASGMFFGVLKVLYSKIVKYKIDDVYILYDRKPYWRTTVFENYKGNRESTETQMGLMFQDYIEQSKDLQEILPHFGFKCVSYPNFECDDLIAAFAYKLSQNKNNKIIIYSSDHDFNQLLEYDNVYTLKTSKKVDILLDKEQFIKQTGIAPNEYKHVLAIAGDKSDFIPSIFAKEILNENDNTKTYIDPPRIISADKVLKILASPYNSLENILDGKINYVKGIGPKTEQLFLNINEKNKESYERNLKIVSLNGEKIYNILTENKNLLSIKCNEMKELLFQHLLEKYECTTIEIKDTFPFYYVKFNNGYSNSVKIDKNKFLELIMK
jgi:5'-3' exonuclease